MPGNCTDSDAASSQLSGVKNLQNRQKNAQLQQKRPFVVKFYSQKNAV